MHRTPVSAADPMSAEADLVEPKPFFDPLKEPEPFEEPTLMLVLMRAREESQMKKWWNDFGEQSGNQSEKVHNLYKFFNKVYESYKPQTPNIDTQFQDLIDNLWGLRVRSNWPIFGKREFIYLPGVAWNKNKVKQKLKSWRKRKDKDPRSIRAGLPSYWQVYATSSRVAQMRASAAASANLGAQESPGFILQLHFS